MTLLTILINDESNEFDFSTNQLMSCYFEEAKQWSDDVHNNGENIDLYPRSYVNLNLKLINY